VPEQQVQRDSDGDEQRGHRDIGDQADLERGRLGVYVLSGRSCGAR
jgi:hypothetical protein